MPHKVGIHAAVASTVFRERPGVHAPLARETELLSALCTAYNRNLFGADAALRGLCTRGARPFRYFLGLLHVFRIGTDRLEPPLFKKRN